MSKKVRDFMLLVFVVLFVLLTVLVSLYASGYKFRLSWPLKFNKILQKTGMLIVNTVPKGATIYLDGQAQRDSSFRPWKKNYLTTPTKIKNVLPGEYLLRLELSGYSPFEKKVRINSGETTFAEDINLFLDAEPLFISSAKEGALVLSPNRRYLYLTGDHKIWNLKNNQTRDLATSATSSQWLASEKLLINGTIFSPDKAADNDYQKMIGREATSWFYEEGTGRLYYQTNNTINRLEADGRTNTAILSGGNYLSYEARGDHLFLVQENDGKIILADYNLKTQKIEQELVLPSVGRYNFIFAGRPTLSLYDEKNKTLYLVNPNNLASGAETLNNIISWSWLSDEQLLYNNPLEIYSFDLKTNRSNLVTRVSEEITKIIWHPNNDYLVFSTAKNIKVADLKNGTITDIFGADQINSLALDEKNDFLYFWAKKSGQAGVYKMLMQ